MRQSIERLGEIWCGLMHDSPMWPVHGVYECRRCGRRHSVPWMNGEAIPVPADASPATAGPAVFFRLRHLLS